MTLPLLSPRVDVPIVASIVRRYGGWLVVSMAAHAVLLALAGGAAVMRVVQEPPIRVTIFEPPAPPPPPLGGGGPPAPAPVVAPPQPVVQPPRPPEPRPVEKPKPRAIAAEKKKALRPEPPRVVEPQPEPAVEPPPFFGTGADAPARPGSPLGSEAGVPGGVVGGKVGGTVGGHGDRVFRADEVASPPVVVSPSMPVYPPLARARGIEGLVLLETIVDRGGHVEGDSVKVVESIPLLDDAAIEALRKWRFRPGRDAQGEAVRVLVHLPVRFRLR